MRSRTRRNSPGQSFVEFCFVMLLAVPFLLITIALGINLIEQLEVIQLSRDTASMYARNTDFTQAPSQAILTQVGNGLGLTSSTSTSKAMVIMSELTYLDTNACATALVSGCTCGSNANNWVFAQYQVFPGAISGLATQSKYGNPSSLVTASDPVIPICNTTTHNDYSTNGAALATGVSNLGITSWATTGSSGYGVPSGLGIYLVEVWAYGYPLPPLLPPPVQLYNYEVL